MQLARTAAEGSGLFATFPPDIIVADVMAAGGAAESVFVRLRYDFGSVALLWVASPSQWAPYAQPRCAVLRSPLQYARLLAEAAALVGPVGVPAFRKPGRLSGRVMNYVSEHFARASVKDVAQAVQLSPGRLSRVFRHEMGLGLKDFLTRVRLEAARCLLLETQEKVGAIAATLGFYYAPHLIRLFKSYSGCTPREYRLMDRT